MILDIDGSTTSGGVAPRRGWMLSVASAAVAAAALVAVGALPREAVTRFAPASGPSVLQQAKPAPPRLALRLPAELAIPLAPTGRTSVASRTYRLRSTSHLVSVAPVPDAAPITAPGNRPADAPMVHGNYAQVWTVEPTSLSVVRWTEHGLTYEISSRTLLARELLPIAEQLR